MYKGSIVKLFNWCIKNAGELNKYDEYNKYVKVIKKNHLRM